MARNRSQRWLTIEELERRIALSEVTGVGVLRTGAESAVGGFATGQPEERNIQAGAPWGEAGHGTQTSQSFTDLIGLQRAFQVRIFQVFDVEQAVASQVKTSAPLANIALHEGSISIGGSQTALHAETAKTPIFSRASEQSSAAQAAATSAAGAVDSAVKSPAAFKSSVHADSRAVLEILAPISMSDGEERRSLSLPSEEQTQPSIASSGTPPIGKPAPVGVIMPPVEFPEFLANQPVTSISAVESMAPQPATNDGLFPLPLSPGRVALGLGGPVAVSPDLFTANRTMQIFAFRENYQGDAGAGYDETPPATASAPDEGQDYDDNYDYEDADRYDTPAGLDLPAQSNADVSQSDLNLDDLWWLSKTMGD